MAWTHCTRHTSSEVRRQVPAVTHVFKRTCHHTHNPHTHTPTRQGEEGGGGSGEPPPRHTVLHTPVGRGRERGSNGAGDTCDGARRHVFTRRAGLAVPPLGRDTRLESPFRGACVHSRARPPGVTVARHTLGQRPYLRRLDAEVPSRGSGVAAMFEQGLRTSIDKQWQRGDFSTRQSNERHRVETESVLAAAPALYTSGRILPPPAWSPRLSGGVSSALWNRKYKLTFLTYNP